MGAEQRTTVLPSLAKENEAGGARKRTLVHVFPRTTSGNRTVARWCSRIVVVAEVDERRLVQVERPTGLARWHARRKARALRE